MKPKDAAHGEQPCPYNRPNRCRNPEMLLAAESGRGRFGRGRFRRYAERGDKSVCSIVSHGVKTLGNVTMFLTIIGPHLESCLDVMGKRRKGNHLIECTAKMHCKISCNAIV